MKMRSKSLCLFTILLLIFLTFSDVVLAQEDNTPPAEIQLALDQTTLKKGQSLVRPFLFCATQRLTL
jgi:CHASE3 domain sensor protein